MHQTSDKII